MFVLFVRHDAQEVTRQLEDRRHKGNHAKHQRPQLTVCLRFLWSKYQFDAEGMPDKWHFDTAANALALSDRKIMLPSRLTEESVEEEECRAIAQAALYAVLADAPSSIATVGPNVHPGPRRYLGVMKPVHLYLMFLAWYKSRSLGVSTNKAPSFSVFLRALESAKPWLKFRKSAGQHANCDVCVHYKQELRKMHGPVSRSLLIEEYNSHLLDQWLDREVDMNLASLSMECATAARGGQMMINLSKRLSSCLLRVDGVDQAKFRVPRVSLKSHAFAKLIRPALHIQGAWCHGFGFHFAVADADCRKDTNNNVEVFLCCDQIECMFGDPQFFIMQP